MKREYYSDSIAVFLSASRDEIFSQLAQANDFTLESTQREAWLQEIDILQSVLKPFQGAIYFEYSIPRIGHRIDVLLLIGPVILVLEFKVGGSRFASYDVDQVWDYALDLKNFHETSHDAFIAPILIATEARDPGPIDLETLGSDGMFRPTRSTVEMLGDAIQRILHQAEGPSIDRATWENGRYSPTPTIIEAALALYKHHSVEEISRSDASAINLRRTCESVTSIIRSAKEQSHKAICFVTGVPGAGKTLVGLNIATTGVDKTNEISSVFLSGNGPLVEILREALVRDKVRQEKARGKKLTKHDAKREIKAIVQNVHHYRTSASATRILHLKNMLRFLTRHKGHGTRNRPQSSCAKRRAI